MRWPSPNGRTETERGVPAEDKRDWRKGDRLGAGCDGECEEGFQVQDPASRGGPMAAAMASVILVKAPLGPVLPPAASASRFREAFACGRQWKFLPNANGGNTNATRAPGDGMNDKRGVYTPFAVSPMAEPRTRRASSVAQIRGGIAVCACCWASSARATA